jgi:predicted S18 family serine protease
LGLAIALVIGLMAGGCIEIAQPSTATNTSQQLLDRIDALEEQNGELRERLDEQNLSVRSYEAQLAFYRAHVSGPVVGSDEGSTASVTGSASLDAPAVLQRTVYDHDGPFMAQRTEQVGSLLSVTVAIEPGQGRILVNTTPLMGTTFQDAANTAAYVAAQKTGRSLSASDVIVSIVAEDEVPAVDGGSAGALMTLLMISAIEGRAPASDAILTGTIDQDGSVGAIGGVVYKAQAAKEAGKSLLLLPRENSRLVRYTEQTREYYGHTIVQRLPEQIDAKEYIESEIGIRVEYVDTIEDVVRLTR